jgi:hypothetical protein
MPSQYKKNTKQIREIFTMPVKVNFLFSIDNAHREKYTLLALVLMARNYVVIGQTQGLEINSIMHSNNWGIYQ